MNSLAKRLSVNVFLCAGFLLVFGLVGFGGPGPGSPNGVEVFLSVVVALAGVYLRGGSRESRVVAIVVLSAVVGYGVYGLTSGHYVPGMIIAGIAVANLFTHAGAFGPQPPAPPPVAPHGYGYGYAAPPPPPAAPPAQPYANPYAPPTYQPTYPPAYPAAYPPAYPPGYEPPAPPAPTR